MLDYAGKNMQGGKGYFPETLPRIRSKKRPRKASFSYCLAESEPPVRGNVATQPPIVRTTEDMNP